MSRSNHARIPRGSGFELYGFDVLIDHVFKPWLLEVNVFPSLSSTSPLDKQIKQHLMTDVFHMIGMQPFDRNIVREAREREENPSAGYIPQHRERKWHFTNKSVIDLEKVPLEEITDPDDLEVVMEAEDELRRSGHLDRIFPCAHVDYYSPFFACKRYMNTLLWKWIRQPDWNTLAPFLRNPTQVPSLPNTQSIRALGAPRVDSKKHKAERAAQSHSSTTTTAPHKAKADQTQQPQKLSVTPAPGASGASRAAVAAQKHLDRLSDTVYPPEGAGSKSSLASRTPKSKNKERPNTEKPNPKQMNSERPNSERPYQCSINTGSKGGDERAPEEPGGLIELATITPEEPTAPNSSPNSSAQSPTLSPLQRTVGHKGTPHSSYQANNSPKLSNAPSPKPSKPLRSPSAADSNTELRFKPPASILTGKQELVEELSPTVDDKGKLVRSERANSELVHNNQMDQPQMALWREISAENKAPSIPEPSSPEPTKLRTPVTRPILDVNEGEEDTSQLLKPNDSTSELKDKVSQQQRLLPSQMSPWSLTTPHYGVAAYLTFQSQHGTGSPETEVPTIHPRGSKGSNSQASKRIDSKRLRARTPANSGNKLGRSAISMLEGTDGV